MYAVGAEPRAAVYQDLWRPGRYRAELAAGLRCDPSKVMDSLARLGYDLVDADQWGRSYRHRREPERTAELDELGDGYGSVRLTLRQADLDLAEGHGALKELRALYGRLQGIGYEPCEEAFWDFWLGGRAFLPRPAYTEPAWDVLRGLDGEAVAPAYS